MAKPLLSIPTITYEETLGAGYRVYLPRNMKFTEAGTIYAIPLDIYDSELYKLLNDDHITEEEWKEKRDQG